ncbi:aminotransferase [Amylibacter marinus]|uniref:Cysteine desulfurase n=1 Tax=Amylibacter marinus TaxID=1475483 RepID=A0ABQ5VT19_9RHOB|nr:cysteine desulfurase family protein [Amylibacter marinus]GLQ34258.1 aminotransferase [Amylibacter marinus]
MTRSYLDWNATTPLRPEARDAMIAAMDVLGNPSSVHYEGRAATQIVEQAREDVAALFGCGRNDIVFAGSATEAAAMALPENASIAASDIEHDALSAWVLDAALSANLDVDHNGILTGQINGTDISDALAQDVVIMQAANSETGVMQNLMPIAQKIWGADHPALVVVDAVQALGKSNFSLDRSGADFALSSAHKIGGPKGIGALYVKPGLETRRLIKGGGQEQGRRSGTENVIGIAGFGAAARAATRDVNDGIWEPIAELRDQFEARIQDAVPEVQIIGQGAARLGNTSCFATPGWKGETQVMLMDLAGFAISAGSACSSGKVKTSKVLKAMGFNDITAASAVRMSIGPTTTTDEVMRFADAWIRAYQKFAAKAA